MFNHFTQTVNAFEAELESRQQEEKIESTHKKLHQMLINFENFFKESKSKPQMNIRLIEHAFANQEKLFSRIGEFETLILRRMNETTPIEFRKIVLRIEYVKEQIFRIV
jgi:hypothetical protein